MFIDKMGALRRGGMGRSFIGVMADAMKDDSGQDAMPASASADNA